MLNSNLATGGLIQELLPLEQKGLLSNIILVTLSFLLDELREIILLSAARCGCHLLSNEKYSRKIKDINTKTTNQLRYVYTPPHA